MEYCYRVWVSAPTCYLELLDKQQKRMCRTDSSSLASTLEPLAHYRNVASFLILERDLLVILIDCMIFLSPFLDVIRQASNKKNPKKSGVFSLRYS